MRWMRKLRLRLRSLFSGSRVEGELEDELRDYLQRETEREIAAGAPPEAARRLAISTLHGLERVKEECRDARGLRWCDDTRSDLRFALRTLRRAPIFTAVVVGALAFCIGANTVIFSVVDTVLFRPLPFPNQDRLVSVTEGVPSLGFSAVPFSCPDYLFIAAHSHSFEALGTYRTQSYEISGTGPPRRLIGARVTASLFQVLQVPPAVGRAFTPEEDEHAKRVAVLSDGFAQSTFGGSERALGRTIFLNRQPYTVVGIMPRSFSFPMHGSRFNGDPAELFVPVSWSNEDRQQNVSNFDDSLIALLRPQVRIPQANAEVRGLLQKVTEDYPPPIKRYLQQHLPHFSLESQMIPFQEEFTGKVRQPLILLLAAVSIVLLIGCADVANLIFSRMMNRQREFALRTALGAGNGRLARQMLMEGLVLSLLGGAVGCGLAWGTLPLLLRFAPDRLPRLTEVGLNGRVTAFVIIVTIAAPLFFCLAPLFSTLRSAVADRLRGGARTSTPGKQQRLAMSGAVVLQFSLAFLLLMTAGLLVRSFLKASEANPGFRPEHVLSVRIALPGTVYNKPAQITSFFNRLLDQLSALPGVQQTGAVSDLPMGSTSWRVISMEGRGSDTEKVDTIFCIGNALDPLRVPLLRGRSLQPGDRLGKQPVVAMISESLAKRMWPHDDPIGKHIKFGVDVPENDSVWMTVVGVVGDVKAQLTSHSPRLMVFTTPEDWVREMNVLVRTSGDPLSLANAIRRQIKQLDSSLPASRIETLHQVLNESLSAERFRTWLLTSFAAAALLLAMLGIAGLLAYNTTQRKQEFGVRIALGADRRDLLLLVFRHGLQLSGIGIVVGALASLIVTRAVSALLYDTSPHDLRTFVPVPLILILVALAASLFPAWRAIRTDPMTVLRAE